MLWESEVILQSVFGDNFVGSKNKLEDKLWPVYYTMLFVIK